MLLIIEALYINFQKVTLRVWNDRKCYTLQEMTFRVWNDWQQETKLSIITKVIFRPWESQYDLGIVQALYTSKGDFESLKRPKVLYTTKDDFQSLKR